MKFLIGMVQLFIIIIIIFISYWYKLVKNTNKNQPSSTCNYSFYAALRTKKMLGLIYL